MAGVAYLMGIDVGTSSLKVLITSPAGVVKAVASQSYQYDAPLPGYAQQEPTVWWQACKTAIGLALLQSGLAGNEIAAVGFSGQMHSIVMLDAAGQSVRPAILHCDSRSSKQVGKLGEAMAGNALCDEMMNPVYTGFLLPSLLWVRENEPEAFAKIHKVCMPKDYLNYRLTGEVSTDYSDASATLAFDIKNNQWSSKILQSAALDASIFPPCHESFSPAGRVSRQGGAESGLAVGTLVVAGGADAVMQGLGNGAASTQVVTANIGSSGQVCFQSDAPVHNPNFTTNTFCGYKKGRWITMGAIMHAGLALKWFNSLFDTADYKKLDAEAEKIGPGSGGLVFLPYLNGERTPHLNPNLSGMFLGCHTGTTRGAMARAVMEGVAFALMQCMEVCGALGLSAQTVVASGGGAQSPLWLQIQADIYNLPLQVAAVSEQAALGAAIAAGAGAGVYRDIEEGCAAAVRYKPSAIEPNASAHKIYRDYYAIFKDAYLANRTLLEKVTLLGRSSGQPTTIARINTDKG